MNRTRWLWLAAGAGVAIFALSFVQGWIVQEREVRGEGYRFVQIFLSAWRGNAFPVTAAAAIGALLAALLAVVAVRGRREVSTWGLLASVLVLGLIGASAWPVDQSGHASSVSLGPWWLLAVAFALSVSMVIGSAAAEKPSRRVVAAAVVLALIAVVGGAGGRWWGLQLAEGTGRHWEVGSYERTATAGEPAETMTLTGETYVIGERWSGAFESSGWTVVLDDDPACPTARGTYHAHGVDEEDLRFVMVVDPCMDGARAADLQAGTWERAP
ncbi:MAG: hypothetical protein M3406_06860 [Chloroflexota bacterium]|nr:hypothetical protein [Chloroflexota bacterium]